MYKTTMIAVLAATAMSAFAHDQDDYNSNWWHNCDRLSVIDDAQKTDWGMQKFIWKQEEELSGPDRYTFEDMMNRMDSNTQKAFIKGLFNAHRQAAILRHEKVAAMYPVGRDGYAMTPDTTMANNMDNESFRPMRMVMNAPRPHDIDFDTALDILKSNLNATECNWVDSWWNQDFLAFSGSKLGFALDSTTADKNVIVRLLKSDASRIDEPIYGSLYTSNLDWVVSQ